MFHNPGPGVRIVASALWANRLAERERDLETKREMMRRAEIMRIADILEDACFFGTIIRAIFGVVAFGCLCYRILDSQNVYIRACLLFPIPALFSAAFYAYTSRSLERFKEAKDGHMEMGFPYSFIMRNNIRNGAAIFLVGFFSIYALLVILVVKSLLFIPKTFARIPCALGKAIFKLGKWSFSVIGKAISRLGKQFSARPVRTRRASMKKVIKIGHRKLRFGKKFWLPISRFSDQQKDFADTLQNIAVCVNKYSLDGFTDTLFPTLEKSVKEFCSEQKAYQLIQQQYSDDVISGDYKEYRQNEISAHLCQISNKCEELLRSLKRAIRSQIDDTRKEERRRLVVVDELDALIQALKR